MVCAAVFMCALNAKMDRNIICDEMFFVFFFVQFAQFN